MEHVVGNLAIIGQGLIGSSIARAVHERGVARQIVVTDASERVRKVVRELGIGGSKVVDTNKAAVEDADIVIACVPVGKYSELVQEIRNHFKRGAILSDVGSVKSSVVNDVQTHIPSHVHFVPGHPIAGSELSGPKGGKANLFDNRWCILTPPADADPVAVGKIKAFWEALGSSVELMTPKHHDHVLAITSHLPHLIAFTIFHTGLKQENATESEMMKFSASGFRDFTRIASSNPTMWRDIFLNNKEAVLDVLKQFNMDLEVLAEAIEHEDGDKLFDFFSKSRLTRRKVIEKEHISVVPDNRHKKELANKILIRPYGWND